MPRFVERGTFIVGGLIGLFTLTPHLSNNLDRVSEFRGHPDTSGALGVLTNMYDLGVAQAVGGKEVDNGTKRLEGKPAPKTPEGTNLLLTDAQLAGEIILASCVSYGAGNAGVGTVLTFVRSRRRNTSA